MSESEIAKTLIANLCAWRWGDGLAFLSEESGDRVSHNRAKKRVATAAEVLGAACRFCNTMFRDALSALSEAPPKLLDIAQIAAASLPTIKQ